MTLQVKTATGVYDVLIERHGLDRVGDLFSLDRKVLIVTDDGVPSEYAATVARCCREPHISVLPRGEKSKSVDSWQMLLGKMLDAGFTRSDCVVAIGGGVVGDLAGFTAACYMRGIDFYNSPTTVLSRVDSSIGGKTAVNFGNVKNIVGAFYPPKKVLIDTSLLSTLSRRQIANGLSEALKMGVTSDAELFGLFENGDPFGRLEEIIPRALAVKKAVVEADENEKGLRRVLNFGHTLGHGIEVCGTRERLHGECVALGMIPMCTEDVRTRLVPVLKKLGLPTEWQGDKDAVLRAVSHDKKADAGRIQVVLADGIGSFRFEAVEPSYLMEKLCMIEKKDESERKGPQK